MECTACGTSLSIARHLRISGRGIQHEKERIAIRHSATVSETPDEGDNDRRAAGFSKAGMLAVRPRRAPTVIAPGQSRERSGLKNNSDKLLINSEAFGASRPSRAQRIALTEGSAGR